MCACAAVVVDDLFVVRKQTPLTHGIPSLCGRNGAALLNIPFRWFFRRQSSFSRSFYLSLVSTVWRLMLTAFHRRQCYLVIYFISKSYAKLILIDSKKTPKTEEKVNSRNLIMVEKQTRYVHVDNNIVVHSFSFSRLIHVCVRNAQVQYTQSAQINQSIVSH